MKDTLVIDGKTYNSRLLIGTGKYKTYAENAAALVASGAEIITVAVRRVNLAASNEPMLQDFIDPKKYTYLPNTAGCFTAADALRTLRLARELGARRAMENEDFVAWGIPGAPTSIGVAKTRVEACGTGVVALQAADPEQVQRLYELAIAQGGCGEAEPCERGGFYAAYFRDPDGNRLNAFCMSQH